MLPLVSIIILCSIAYFLIDNYYLKRRSLPPGPAPLPFVGNVIQLGKAESAAELLMKWRKVRHVSDEKLFHNIKRLQYL
jgi:hypothetical protein